MDKGQVKRITREFAASIDQEVDLLKVILYGSWIDGHPDEDSDIDIAVVIRECTTDYLDLLTTLYRHASAIDIRIEPNLFEAGRDASGFLDHILRKGEVIYEKQTA